MANLDPLLEKLKDALWVIDDLKSIFKSKLIQSLVAKGEQTANQDTPIYILAALRYNVIKIADLSLSDYELMSLLVRSVRPNLKLLSDTIKNSETFQNDLEYLSALDSRLANLYASTIQTILEVDANDFSAASSPLIFGAEVITGKYYELTQIERVLSMIHELAHHELFLINLADRLISPRSDENYIYAPFQGKNRPPIGRLHSAHALYRMILFAKHCGLDTKGLRADLIATIDSFNRVELTPFANRLVFDVYSTV